MSVVVIDPFEVPAGKEAEALAFRDRVTAFMHQQPGFISTRLQRAAVPWARSAPVTIAVAARDGLD